MLNKLLLLIVIILGDYRIREYLREGETVAALSMLAVIIVVLALDLAVAYTRAESGRGKG